MASQILGIDGTKTGKRFGPVLLMTIGRILVPRLLIAVMVREAVSGTVPKRSSARTAFQA